MKRVLISGGAGFIGSHLCERLLGEGNDVICIDNYFTGHKSNIRHLLKHPNFEVIRHDIIYPYMAEVEEIYNLACPASPIYYQHDPVKTTQTSVIGAMNMLGMARYNRAKVLQASTSEVYGDPLVHPQTEDYWGHVNPLGLRSCYDEGKRCAESLFMSYYREHGIIPELPRIAYQQTDTINVKSLVSFDLLSKKLDMPIEELQFLNPAFKLDAIPYTPTRHYAIVLPSDKALEFAAQEQNIYQEAHQAEAALKKTLSYKATTTPGAGGSVVYRVKKGDTLSGIAVRYGVTVSKLKTWNHLNSTKLSIGQRLTIYPKK